MAITSIRGKQIVDGSVQRADLDTTTAGQAVTSKIVQGSGITLSSTGADSGTGDVTVSGSVTFVTKTAAYTLTIADSGKYVICSGGSWTLTFPAPAAGLYYRLRNDMGISGTIGTITLSPTGGTIDGLSSIALLPQQECNVISDGTNWRTFELKREVVLGTQDITSSTASGTILLPVGYRYFKLEFTNFVPITNPDYLAGRLSINGGSTWLSANYYHAGYYNSSTTVPAFFAAENVASLQIIPNCVGSGGGPLPGQTGLTLYPGTATQNPSWIYDGVGRTGSLTVKWNGGGWNVSTGPVNAFQYFAGAGNIATCSVTVKGVV